MQHTLPEIEIVLLAFVDEKKVLLNRRSDADDEMWEMIGGGVEEGESPEDAICREITEEVGYTLRGDKDNLRLAKQFTFSNHKFHSTVYCFTARFPGMEFFTDSEEVKIHDLQLFSRADLLHLPVLPMTKRFLEEYYND